MIEKLFMIYFLNCFVEDKKNTMVRTSCFFFNCSPWGQGVYCVTIDIIT